MYIVDEKDKEYRFKDSGPKYLMKGPRMNFAVVQFMPGQDFKFIRSCDRANQNPLIQTILLQFFRKGFQLGARVGVKADVSGIERV